MQEFREQIAQCYAAMLAGRGQKFRWFLRALRSFRHLAGRQRGEFLESYYAAMRSIDDVIDGDSPLPRRYATPEEYVSRRISVLSGAEEPCEPVDAMLQYALQAGMGFGHDFREETQDILGSLRFDARRVGKLRIFPEEELKHYFHLLDIRGTVRATMKVFGEDPHQYELLSSLGMACRIYYNLRDYSEDVSAGYVNISREDIRRLGIEPQMLPDRMAAPVMQWQREQAARGMELLEAHSHIPLHRFRPLSRLAFPLVYEWNARRYFSSVLSRRGKAIF